MAQRSKSFVFTEPENLQYHEFDYSQYTEFFNQDETTEEMLVSYILKEADFFRQQMLEDVSNRLFHPR